MTLYNIVDNAVKSVLTDKKLGYISSYIFISVYVYTHRNYVILTSVSIGECHQHKK